MCNYVSLSAFTKLNTSSCRLRCSSSRLSVLPVRPKATCWIHNIKNPRRAIVNHLFWVRTQQKDCIYQQPCTTQAIFQCPTGPRSSCLQRACQPLRTLLRASRSDTHFVPRVALTSRTPLSPRPGSEIVCTAARCCSSSSCPFSFSLTIHRVFASVQHQAVQLP